MVACKVLFWFSCIVVFYTYAGYPLLLLALSRRWGRPVMKESAADILSVSVVVAVRNEEAVIVRRLTNLLSQDYPAELLEIIVVSDGSTDRTDLLVRQFPARAVRLVRLERTVGKAAALNAGVAVAQGDLLVFTDTRQRFAPGAVRALAANFADLSVGCVSGELVFTSAAESDIRVEMGSYWRYEKWIRKLESRTGSTVGATGAIYAVRKSLYCPLPEGTILDDVLIPLHVVRRGYRCLFDGTALAYDTVSKDVRQEWRRKVRTLAGNWQLLGVYPGLLLPTRNPVWWRFLSHKLFRLLVPVALVVLLISGALLEGGLYRAATLAQLLFYGAALFGYLAPATRSFRFIGLSYFFLVMNAAAVVGFWLWVTGRSASVWRPASRS